MQPLDKLAELVGQRSELIGQQEQLRIDQRDTEDSIKRELFDHHMEDCFTINWRRVNRVLHASDSHQRGKHKSTFK